LLTVAAGGEPPQPGAIHRAVAALQEGQVVAVPTDTVYGLAVDPRQPVAVARLFALKGRPTSVALPVLVAGWDQVESLALPFGAAAEQLAVRHWPGPLTLVVPRSPTFTADLGGPPSARDTVGLRWPDHPVMASLCRAFGPMAVTSANRHGGPPATTPGEVGEQFAPATEGDEGGPGGPGLSLLLDGGRCAGSPSTVVECRGSAVRCLRDGALSFAALVTEVDSGGSDGEPGDDEGGDGAG
jgi:L-threonylcarbamoyladenylate synthase